MRTRLLLLAALLLPAAASAQFSFEARPQAATLLAGTDTLHLAWSGGLNSPQFSNLDLDGDGQTDLMVFDRMTSRVSTFLNAPRPGGGRRWQYAPHYEALFPSNLKGFALLRDYDCDGRPDLFTQGTGAGDIRVLRNVAGAGGRPAFQLASAQLQFFNSTTLSGNIFASTYDIPAIEDVDGDGRLDILVINFFQGQFIEYYRNVSTGCGGLEFEQGSDYWADLQICGSSCTAYATGGDLCRQPTPTAGRPAHTGGHGLLLRDLDGDLDMDLLIGRDGCHEWTAIRNTGTRQTATTGAGSVLGNVPAGIGAVNLPNFPVGYSVDVTFDGRPDLLVAPGLADNLDLVSLRRKTLLLENTGTVAAPAFTRRTEAFLQEQMLDRSEGAYPAFGDVSGDGLVDMLVGNYADQTGNTGATATYFATLAYYQNVGTASKPAFKLVTDDYLGLSAQRYANLHPVLTDLNLDGRLDLAYTAHQAGATKVIYHLNTAPGGQAAAFDVSQFPSLDLQYNWSGKDDVACFFDVDGDGLIDLLMGTNDPNPGGSLRYYRRQPGQPLTTAFQLANNDLGQVRNNGQRPLNLVPAVADVDGDGTPDLLTIDARGQVQLFTSFRTQAAPFLPRTDVFYNPITQQHDGARLGLGEAWRLGLALADVNSDGAPELFIGLESGGINVFGARNRVTAVRRAAASWSLQVYPNPAAAATTVESGVPTRLALLDLTGRLMREQPVAQRRHQLGLEGLPAGVYLLRVTSPADGSSSVQRLVVQ
ncbi:T9SS type A sorting domain-containing protein [Hymenobacter sp. B81]|uniref:T9SS type A sorting domain-containing protein n=1 Tax=Hymenobacter sp. B81 TaxID=3344878 RepID=UPI0037DCBBC5